MSAGKLKLKMEQGATFERLLTITNDDGTAFDLTGCEARAQARALPSSAEATFDFDVTIYTPETLGQITIGLSATDTESIDCSAVKYPGVLSLVWDMEIEVTLTGVVTRILQGVVEVSPEVTR